MSKITQKNGLNLCKNTGPVNYHVDQNSFYLKLVKLRFKGKDYGRYIVHYSNKSNGALFMVEKNVKILDKVKAFWSKWE